MYNANIERNKILIREVNLLNDLLKKNNFNPIFLKGSSNIISGLYNDIGERMVGDIDFIVPEKEAKSAYLFLKDNSYFPLNKNFF